MKLALAVLAFLLLQAPACAQLGPKQQVESYFEALLQNRVEKALKALGVDSNFSPSQQAVLKEYKVVNAESVGICEENLEALGRALADYNRIHSGYPAALTSLPGVGTRHCPTTPKKPYRYERRDSYFYQLSCPTGHGRTPGFPKYSPIDGLLTNPNLRLLTGYKVMDVRQEHGLTKVRVVGATPRGIFERDFVFTPAGGFVEGDFSKEVERLIRGMTENSIPRVTKLDPASLLLGVASFKDQELIRAAHCRLLQEKLYYSVLGVQNRLGEKGYTEVVKHLEDIPRCPTSGYHLRIGPSDNGGTEIFCPGPAHTEAGLERNRPRRVF